MAKTKRFKLPGVLFLATLIPGLAVAAVAQNSCPSAPSAQQGSRLAGDWHASAAVALAPAKSSVVSAGADLGIAPAATRLDRMLLLLQPSAAQQQALDTFLQNQQVPGNCAYHAWLTPAQFADSFANSASDVTAISAWLSSQGFSVAPLPAGRGWVEFSGTAAEVEQAFGAPVHAFATPSGTRHALTSGISVPASFVPLIRGLVSLDGALSTPALTTPRPVATAASALAAQSSPAQAEALTPKLVAPLLHLDAVHAAGTTGAGQTIAIAARSNVQTADIAAFRSTFGLPESAVTVKRNGADPGLTGDQAEAEFAASWAGAAAPGASILVVPAATTSATDGIDLSLAAIVDQDLAHTVVVDFSSCEGSLSDAHQAFYVAVYRQAAAQGMAAIAAAGDSGAAACQAPGSPGAVTTGYAVNGLASTPWNTSVGAAAFAASDASSFSAWSPVAPADPAYAGGGGRSAVFAIPAWQSGIQPQSSGRMLPDVALPTGIDSAFSRGLAFCFSGAASPSGCTVMRSGGTSAAAAIFGGIAALIAQQNGAQGNLAPALYSLSTRPGVFTDVQQGAATLACEPGSPDCDATGHIGFAAAAGYDLATGLGSPNAQKLLAALAQPDATTYTVNTPSIQGPQPSNPSAALTLSTSVSASTGSASGYVNFCSSSAAAPTPAALNSAPIALAGGQASYAIPADTLSGTASGTNYSIYATFLTTNTSTCSTTAAGVTASGSTTLTMTQSTTTVQVTPSTYNPTANVAFSVAVTVNVGAPPAGTVAPTNTVTLVVDPGTASTQTFTQTVSTAGNVTTANFSNITLTSSGAHSLQATYNGDSNYQVSPAVTQSVTVGTLNASVALTVSPIQQNNEYNPSTVLSFTATVTPQTAGGPTPTGTVNFLDQATGLNLNGATPVTLTGGVATVSNISGLPQNGNSIIAQYTPATGSSYTSANSQAVTVNIQPSQTTTTLAPSTTTPAVNTPFSVTATVAVTPNTQPPAGPASPQGTVTLTVDNGTTGVPSQTQPVTTANSVSSATFTNVTVPTSGNHNLQATFNSSNGNYSSSSPSQVVTVNGGGTSVNFNWNGSITSGQTFAANATITFTVTLTGANGGPTPTGTLTILDQPASGPSITLGSAPLTNGTATVSETGKLPPGSNSITAQYTPAAGSTYTAATSAPIAVTVSLIPTTATVVPSTTTPSVGTPFNVTVNVAPTSTPAAGTAPPTGNIQLDVDGTLTATNPIVASGFTGSATFSVTLSTAGPHTLQAMYTGDTNYAASALSSAVTVTAAKPILPVTVTLTASPTLAGPQQSITFTATVTPTQTPAANTEQNPTGNVTFFAGSTILGSAPLSAGPGDTAIAQLSTSSLPAGQDTVTAVYAGDTAFAAGTSNPVTVTVQDFTITPAPSNPPEDLDIVKGSSGQASYTISGLGGFNNIISVVCNTQPQDDLSCQASPQQVTPTQTVTFTITTYTTGGPAAERRSPPLWPPAAGGAALAALFFFVLPSGKRARRFLGRGGRWFAMLLLLVGLAGTGIGCTSVSGTASNQVNGTPLGLTTVTITAAADIDDTVVSHSVYLLVDVLPQGSTGTAQPAVPPK